MENYHSDALCICVDLAVIPECGEDSFAFHVDEYRGLLCVTDGCGGLGAKRYPGMGGHTGAYLASRIVTECVVAWEAAGMMPFPNTKGEGEALCNALASNLGREMSRREALYASPGNTFIVSRMQRALPSTLCLSLFRIDQTGWLDALFLWAGDSRGYVLNVGGLHQLTADHTSIGMDALEGLYGDAPLLNMVNGDQPFEVSGRRVRLYEPAAIIVATDGAFMYLPTPMEFEWMLLSTLRDSSGLASWQGKLKNILKKVASDDCTLLISLAGFESFEAFQAAMEKRCADLQQEYITPVRRRKQRLDFAGEKWEQYREAYDWTKGQAHGELDWRV